MTQESNVDESQMSMLQTFMINVSKGFIRYPLYHNQAAFAKQLSKQLFTNFQTILFPVCSCLNGVEVL